MTDSDLPRTSELNRRLSIMGVAAYCRVSGRETGGAYSVMEHIFAPGTGPAFLHMHPAQETVIIRDGTFETYCRGASGKETKRLGPGEIHHIPSKIPHGLKNVGETEGRAFIVFHPADLQRGSSSTSMSLQANPRGRQTPPRWRSFSHDTVSFCWSAPRPLESHFRAQKAGPAPICRTGNPVLPSPEAPLVGRWGPTSVSQGNPIDLRRTEEIALPGPRLPPR